MAKTKEYKASELPSHDTMMANIASVFTVTGDKAASWYFEQHKILEEASQLFNLPIESVCGVCAVISPQLKWERNLVACIAICSDSVNGCMKSSYGVLGQNLAKAIRILQGESPDSVLGGNKVRSFYHNLLNPAENNSIVTIDRHALSIALFGAYKGKSGGITVDSEGYMLVSAAYVSLADSLNMLPSGLQSSVWVYKAQGGYNDNGNG